MKTPIRLVIRSDRARRGRALATLLALTGLAVLGVFSYATFYASRTIYDLLGENKDLRSAIGNLTHEDQIGYAKVIGQETRDGKLYTRLIFVETDRIDPTVRLLEREYEIEGDIAFFDALIVKFGTEVVAEGDEKSLYLWRRVYGENQAPTDGYPIEEPGIGPARYAELSSKLSIRDREMFWEEIWKLSDDPERLLGAGVRAIYGNVVYKRIRPGLIYVFKIDASGNLFPEIVPDL